MCIRDRDIDVERDKIDMLSLSAHKFHGPKGVGALYCRKGLPLLPFIEGGAQERNRRAGTENLAGRESISILSRSTSISK